MPFGNMKKEIANKIKIAASWLPVEHRKITVKRPGRDLIAEGIAVDANKDKIDPKRIYAVGGLEEVNHENRMKAAYDKEGLFGVEQYLAKYKDHIAKIKEQKAAEDAAKVRASANPGGAKIIDLGNRASVHNGNKNGHSPTGHGDIIKP